MKLQELGRMSAKERLTWINTAKVQDLNTILKEVEIGSADEDLALWQVVKETTMPDGQYALKIVKVRN